MATTYKHVVMSLLFMYGVPAYRSNEGWQFEVGISPLGPMMSAETMRVEFDEMAG